MEELPSTLLAAVPDALRVEVHQWWERLPAAARTELGEWYDPQREECFFGTPVAGEIPPTVVGGCFLPHDDACRIADWQEDWREYLTEHPAESLGDRWADGSVILASQFPTVYRFDGSGFRCRIVDWDRTRFEEWERPPSEQRSAALHGATP